MKKSPINKAVIYVTVVFDVLILICAFFQLLESEFLTAAILTVCAIILFFDTLIIVNAESYINHIIKKSKDGILDNSEKGN